MRQALSINLASQPFRRDRPFVVAAVAGCTLLAALLAYQVLFIYIRHNEATEARAAVDQTRRQALALSAEQSRLESTLREPANAEALDYSIFLNALLRRKGISWTRIFTDLEDVMPHNVRLVAVRPQVSLDNQVQLDMTVAATAPEPVIEMIRKMEGSSRFGATQVQRSEPPSQSQPLHQYRVNAKYAPQL